MSASYLEAVLSRQRDGAVRAVRPQTRRAAWVTLLSNEAYLKGVEALWRSLEAVETEYPLVVMVTDHVSTSTRQSLVQQVHGASARPGLSLCPESCRAMCTGLRGSRRRRRAASCRDRRQAGLCVRSLCGLLAEASHVVRAALHLRGCA